MNMQETLATEIKHLQAENEKNNKDANSYAHKLVAMLKRNERLREALEGWMIDHGHRCRICTERSQTALKE